MATLLDTPLFRRLSADAFVRYDPAADSFAVVPASVVPALAPVVPRRVRMSEGDPAERRAGRFRRLILSAMLEFQHKAHRAGSPESAQPYLDALAKLLDDPQAEKRLRLKLSWGAATTRAGAVKAVGAGEHAGRTLYGARATAALKAQEARGGMSHSEVTARAQKSSERAKEIIGKAVTYRASKEEIQELAEHLPHLPAERLRSARLLLGASFGGGKTVAKMRSALMDHVRGLVDQMEIEEKNPKPEPEAATEPLTPQPAKPKTPKAAGPPKPGEVRTVPTGSLKVDPTRFQFKLNTNAEGVTKELREVKTFNPEFAGVVAVWKDPADGQDYVVNGHHRHELASRTGHPDLAVRYLDAKDAREARAKGALINIAEGRGTAVDAAKFMRDMGVAPEDLEKHGVSLKGKLASDAATLTKLNDKAFDRVARGTLDAEKALAVARYLSDPVRQEKLFGLLDKREEEGKDLSGRTIEELARQMAAVPGVTKTESTLWGDETTDEDTFVERAELASHTRGELAKDHNDFAAVASDRRAGKVAGAGNTLNVEENKKRAEEAEGHKNLYDIHAHRKGPVADALDAAAVKYKNAKGKKERDRVRTETVESVRAALKAKLAEFVPKSAGPDDGAGESGVDSGRVGGSGAEPPASAASGGRETPPDAGRGSEQPASVDTVTDDGTPKDGPAPAHHHNRADLAAALKDVKAPKPGPGEFRGQHELLFEAHAAVIRKVLTDTSADGGEVADHGMSVPEKTRQVVIDGVAIHWPDTPEGHDQAAASLASIVDAHPKLWGAQGRVVFSSQRNSADAYWAEKYNIPDFRAAASGGDGTTVVYNGGVMNQYIFSHEGGHGMANKQWGQEDPPADSEYGLAQTKEGPVSKYGSNSPAEDFAEAVAFYTANPTSQVHNNFKANYPLKFAAIQKFMGGGDDNQDAGGTDSQRRGSE